MVSLGFTPTPNSGSGWLIKEDGQNENAICQLKSTDANSIRIDLKDIEKLEYNSLVSHKIPVFVIQFLNTDERFLVLRPELLADTLRVVKGERPIIPQTDLLNLDMEDVGVLGGIQKDTEISDNSEPKGYCKKLIKSNANSRKSFMEANAERYKKKTKSAK